MGWRRAGPDGQGHGNRVGFRDGCRSCDGRLGCAGGGRVVARRGRGDASTRRPVPPSSDHPAPGVEPRGGGNTHPRRIRRARIGCGSVRSRLTAGRPRGERRCRARSRRQAGEKCRTGGKWWICGWRGWWVGQGGGGARGGAWGTGDVVAVLHGVLRAVPGDPAGAGRGCRGGAGGAPRRGGRRGAPGVGPAAGSAAYADCPGPGCGRAGGPAGQRCAAVAGCGVRRPRADRGRAVAALVHPGE